IASRSRGSETLLGRTWQSTIRLRASFMNPASRVRGMASIVEMFRSRLVGLYGSWRATPRMRGGAPRQECEVADPPPKDVRRRAAPGMDINPASSEPRRGIASNGGDFVMLGLAPEVLSGAS